MASVCTSAARAGYNLVPCWLMTNPFKIMQNLRRSASSNTRKSKGADVGIGDIKNAWSDGRKPQQTFRSAGSSATLENRDCISLTEYSRDDIERILWTAIDLKQLSGSGGSSASIRVGESGSPLGRTKEDRMRMRMPRPADASATGAAGIPDSLRGLLSHIIFEIPDIHQRLSVEAGVHLLGGTTSYLAPGDIHFAESEALADTMSTFAACSNLLWCRLQSHEFVEQLARECSAPVINAGSSRESPITALAHLLTLYETYGTLRGLTLAWVGPPTAVLNSLLLCATHFAAKFTIAVEQQHGTSAENPAIPESGGKTVDAAILTQALRICSESNAEVHSVSDKQDALWRAHVIFCGSESANASVANLPSPLSSVTSPMPVKPALPKNVKSLIHRDAEDEQMQRTPPLSAFMDGKLRQRLTVTVQPETDATSSALSVTNSNRLEQDMFEQADLEWTFVHSLPRTSKEVSSAVHYGQNSRSFSSVANRKWICAALAVLLTRPYKPAVVKPNFMDY